MSDYDVYQGEMTNDRLSDQDIERFFSGETPESESLARLAIHVEAWHAGYERAPSEESVTEFAAEAAEIATSLIPIPAPQATPAAAVTPFIRFRSALRRKLATGLASVLLLSGMTGVAVASNGAAPGDTLYGLDQALETFGILDGEAAERIGEAQSLFDDGLVAEAISHAAEAVAQTQDAESFSPESAKAAEALERAAASVANGDAESEDVREAVAEMLGEMAGWIAEPTTLGKKVSDSAKKIAGAPDDSPDAADNPAENAADEARGNGEGAGPPDDVPAGPPADRPGPP